MSCLAPAQDEAAARAVIDAARREHWDARHHCSAFILGPDRAIERSSDDGEPSGTAGAPMLEVLRGSGYTDVVAVVTRWFGGTLLGAGGLVRAYSDAVHRALAAATPRERVLRELWNCDVDHALAGRVESELRRAGFGIADVAYGAAVTLTLAADPGTDVAAVVAPLTAGTATPRRAGERWMDA